MATIVTRAGKGTPLTNAEMDANFNNLNADIGAKLASASYTAADVLSKLATVDGSGSGLDADLLRGVTFTSANTASTIVSRDTFGNFSAGTITASLTGGTISGLSAAITLGNGGTGAALTAANGGIVYSTATTLAILGAGTAGTYLKSGGAGAPSWGTVAAADLGASPTALKYLAGDMTWQPILTEPSYTVTGITGPAATITVDFSTVNGTTIIIPLPTGVTSANITFTNLASKATAGQIFSFTAIVSHVTALTATTSVVFRHGAAVVPKWTGGIVPPSTIAAAAVDVWTFFTYDQGTSLVGSLAMADVK